VSHSLFISDLHLCDSRPHINQAFIQFLQTTATQAKSLFILGDLFEYWAGDDAIAIGQHQAVIGALKNLSQTNTQVFFMHGNRDFLLGDTFAVACGATFLPDPSLLMLFEKPVLLSHGDALCTDDTAYMQFREIVRNAAWQAEFLAQPLSQRIAYIEKLRTKSEQEKSTKSMQIMDVNANAVAQLMRENNYPPLLIHGHTHRPNTHLLTLDGHKSERWVLGDWYEHGSYLSLDEKGCHAHAL
jgi:UDP-2,3-diacylglucosamine hydrolase